MLVAAMGVWVLREREREEERKEGFEVMAAMGVGEKERKKSDFDCVG